MKKIIGVMLSLVVIIASITISTKPVQAAVILPLSNYPAGTAYSGGCWNFANLVYQAYWGYSFTNSQYTNDNLIKDVAITASARQATAANLKKYIMQSPVGSCVRISTTLDYVTASSDGDLGHSFIILSYDSNGFTYYDVSGGKVNVTYRTYDYFATYIYINNGNQSIGNAYLKYIKAGSGGSSAVTVVSRKNCYYIVTIPAWYKLNCYVDESSAVLSDRFISPKEQAYTLGCDTKVVLSNGSTRYRFTSGDGYTLYFIYDATCMSVEALHSFTSVTTKKATCTENGIRTLTCSDCGESYTETIAKYGHYYSSGYTVDKVPTCTEDGIKSKHCLRCSVKKDIETIPALGHKFPEQTITGEHGNSTEIIETVTCERCTEQKQYIIPANPHKFLPNYWTTDKQPTCTEAGEKSIHCIYIGCNYRSRITEIPALGHTCEEWDVIKEASCTQTGIKVGKCSVCGGKDEKEIAVTPHNYNSIYFNPATCNSGGERVAKCDTCAYKSVTEIKGGHFYKNGKCVTCNIGTEVVESAHTYGANSNYTWTVTKVGADHLNVVFSEETETEEKYDIIYIYDGNDNLIGEYSGKELSGKNINILSDTVKIKLLSDNSFQKYGFYAVVTPKSNEGDINGDSWVNADDILNVRFSILSGNSNMIYDINNDGKVNVKDLVKIKKMIAIGNIIPVPPAFDLVG